MWCKELIVVGLSEVQWKLNVISSKVEGKFGREPLDKYHHKDRNDGPLKDHSIVVGIGVLRCVCCSGWKHSRKEYFRFVCKHTK